MICFRTFLILSACFLVAVAMVESEDYLYAGRTKVVKEFNPEDGDVWTLFMNIKAPRVVEFYSPNCPACVRFSPHYIQLAKNTRNKYPEIQFFGVSCDKYEQLCEKYGINGYPMIRLFKHNDGPTSMGESLEFNAEYAEDESTPKKIANLLKIKEEEDQETANPTKSERSEDSEDSEDEEENDMEEEKTSTSSENEGDDQATAGTIKAQSTNDDNDDDDTSKSESEEVDQATAVPTKSENENDEDEDDDTSKSSESEKEDQATANPRKSENNEDNDDDDDDDETSNSNENKEGGQAIASLTKLKRKDSNDDDNNKSSSSSDGEEEEDDGDQTSNRYSQILKSDKENYFRKRQGLGKYLRKDETKDKQGKLIEKSSYEEMTKGMKQYTLGTKEFEDRKQAIGKRIEKSGRKNKLQARTQDLKKESLPYKKDMTKPKWLKSTASKIPLVKKMFKMSKEEELILDATLSFTVSLETGLLMGIEDVTSKSALRDWLNLLSVSLPPEWNIHKLIDHIRNNFEYATKSKDNLRQIMKNHPLARTGWSASCQNKNLELTGFSCGFWKLLHVITLGVAEQRGGQNLIDSGMMSSKTVVFSPSDAADTIRNYIDKFFNCRPCRDHFITNYDDCKNNRRCKRLTNDKNAHNPADWKELSLWLWEVHNDISVRLIGERISTTFTKGVKNIPSVKDEVSVIWPNVNNCILCFNSNGIWNNGEVFRFLERTYWPDSETDPLYDKLLTFDSEGRSGAGLLWLITFLIIWLVYKATGKQSYSIHESLLSARRLVSLGTTRKSRTA